MKAAPSISFIVSCGVLTLLIATGGCGRAPADSVDEQTSQGDSVTIVDVLNRRVVISQPCDRIVSLVPAQTEILFAIGAGKRVVGVSSLCNFPAETADVAKIGGYSPEMINLEQITVLNPDIVFCEGAFQEALVARLESLGITVVAFDPQSIGEVVGVIRLTGKITGDEEQADKVAKDMQDDIAAVEAEVARIATQNRPRVFYQVWDQPLQSVSSKAMIGMLIERAGGENIFADLPQPYPNVSAEAVVSRDPEIILAAAHGEMNASRERILEQSQWQTVTAVKNERVVFLPADIISRPGPRLGKALALVAAALHPDHEFAKMNACPNINSGMISMSTHDITNASYIETSQGWIGVAATQEIVARVVIGRKSKAAAQNELNCQNAKSSRFTDELAQRLADFVAGDLVDLADVKIDDSQFTPFRKRVTAACRKIPCGTVVSYGKLAAEVGSPKAARAVGGVMASNPFPLIVPCHRVVGSTGALTGFSAPDGVSLKQRLLNVESALVEV